MFMGAQGVGRLGVMERDPLMVQGDHGKVWFRNIVLTPAK